MIKILIADDHVVLRAGLRALLDNVEGWKVIGEAGDGFEVEPLVEQLHPDIVILDLSMPNLDGVQTITRLQKTQHRPTILVLSARDDDFSVGEAIRAGAKGFLPKSSSTEELHFAIRSLLKGQTYLSPTVCSSIVHRTDEKGQTKSPLAVLSDREKEVMKLLTKGMPNREVAKLLHISPRTIDSHRSNIMKKLGISSNAELVQIALRSGMVE